MKAATLKLYELFMVNVIGPLVKNEKFVLALLLCALGGGLYTIADFLGLTHPPHVAGETFEEHVQLSLPARPLFLLPEPAVKEVIKKAEAPTADAVEDLPYADSNHEHDDYALRNHEHPQKNWQPDIDKAMNN